MNNSRFLEELAERAKTYGFQLTEYDEIREKKTGCCPVIAVWLHKNNLLEGVDNHLFSVCASNMEMDEEFAKQVAFASDGHHVTHPHLEPVRKELEEVLGL